MKFNGTMGIGFAALLLASGCAHRLRVNSVNVSEQGTYVVATPGALTIARQSGSSSRTCTLHTGGHAGRWHGKHGKHGKASAGGPSKTLDTLLFRLCEARANNDITPAQYAASVQMVLKTMAEMAKHRPPPPPPPMRARRPWGGPGMRGRWSRDRDGNRGFRDRRGGERGRMGPEQGPRPEGRGGPGARPGEPPKKGPGAPGKGHKRRQHHR